MSLQLNPEIFRAVLESLPIGVYLTDLKRQIAFWNTSAERITGYLGQEVIGHFCHDNLLMHCDESQMALCGETCPLAETMLDGRPRKVDIFLRHKDGQRIPVRVHSVPIRDEFSAVIGAAEFFEERSFQGIETRWANLRPDASLDGGMEIPGGKAMKAKLAAALEGFGAPQSFFGVLVMGIDNLDRLRHVDGCQAVKEVMYAIAETLLAGTRPEDMVCRWSDERFAAFVANPAPDGLRSCAERFQRLMASVAVPWWGDRLSVTVSIGGTLALPDDTVQSLAARAEAALENAAGLKPGSVLVV